MVGIAIPTQSGDRHCWFYSKPTAVFLLQLFEGERLCVSRRHRFSVFTPFRSRTFSTAVLCRRASCFGGFIDFRSCLLSGSISFSLNGNTFANRILCMRVKPATGRPYVRAFSLSGTVPAFTCDCLRFVCAFTPRPKVDLCVSTSSRTMLAFGNNVSFSSSECSTLASCRR